LFQPKKDQVVLLQQNETLRDELRARCMPAHERLEALVEGAGYFDTPQRYRGWLAVMYDMHLNLAAGYDAGAAALGMTQVSKDLLMALLQDLGRSDVPELPQRNADETGIGVAYVFEGSAMGGRLLQRRVAQMVGAPSRYIDLLVETSKTRWPFMKEALNAFQGDPDPIVSEAMKTFEALFAGFEEDAL
jgi:heme oxygenase